MHNFKSTKYLTTTALITAVLTTISLIFSLFVKLGSNSIFQPADGLYLALISLIKGPMMLFAGIIFCSITDLVAGGVAYIPMSIIVRILMFLIVYFFTKKIKIYFSFLFASLCLFLYVFYTWILFGIDMAKYELITDVIQSSICYIVGLSLCFSLKRINFIWDKINNEFYSKKY